MRKKSGSIPEAYPTSSQEATGDEKKAPSPMSLRLTEEDEARCQRLMKHYALARSSVIRMILKQADDAVTAAKEKR